MVQLLGSLTPLVPISRQRAQEVFWKQQILEDALEAVLNPGTATQTCLTDNKSNKGNKQSYQKDRSLTSSIFASPARYHSTPPRKSTPRVPRIENTNELTAPQKSNLHVSDVSEISEVSEDSEGSEDSEVEICLDLLLPRKSKPRVPEAEAIIDLTKAPASNGVVRETDNDMSSDSLYKSIHVPRYLRRAIDAHTRASNSMASSEMTGNQEEADDRKHGTDFTGIVEISLDNVVRRSASGETPTRAADKPRSFSQGSTGTNREAASFTPSAHFSGGVRSPEDFMKQFREMQVAKAAQASKPLGPSRRIIFKNLPDWAGFNDIMCLVHGGAVEAITKSGEREMSVDFIDPDSCQTYADIHKDGILVHDQVITVEVGEAPNLDESVQVMVVEGKSRVVSVEVPDHTKFAALQEIFSKFDLDHCTYWFEANKARL
ncbi:hypothetical protein N7456_011907 [Penicillium angulare]|uniref:Uncharacterized protein n=1 Tax=Penicillium angulare TaxID=116970 RepID=A0A9W9K0L9_9EURO|nr:hypothetical protein N7456_011907 [Penicillium angulare]